MVITSTTKFQPALHFNSADTISQSTAKSLNMDDLTSTTTPGTPYPAQESRLLALPAELRLQIFEPLLMNLLPISLFISSTGIRLWGQGIPPDVVSYLLVNKQLYFDLHDVIWSRLHFRIRAESGYGLPQTRRLPGKVTPNLLSSIRHLEINFPITSASYRDGPYRTENVEPALDAVEKISGLRSVTFNCGSDLWVYGGGDHRQVSRVAACAWKPVLARLQERGVEVRISNPDDFVHGIKCMQIFQREETKGDGERKCKLLLLRVGKEWRVREVEWKN
jgi:hypothetical protein